MKAFHTIAIPHQDILDGRLTMDVFAADLYEVSKNRGSAEYKDADIFFKKTYLTQGLQNLLSILEKRLKGQGGDPVIQIHTPFGGGKTHSLIALYHKSKKWKTNTVVLVGTALKAEDTLWGLIEKQLTGKISKLKSITAPGRETIKELLEQKQPVMILMDEVLQYVTKAAGVKVGNSNLAAQTIAFMQELSETVGTVEKASLVVTLPSSVPEHYDKNAEELYQKLQKVSGRIEKIYTPVEENEITSIIRSRLFSNVDYSGTKAIVDKFMDYADKEEIIPGMFASDYRDDFIASYPFMPDVVKILYERWGTFPTFQRTRGVLRLLSLVIHSLKSSNKSYISLADFDLSNQEIRQELLKHIGAEFNGVISSDISGKQSGAKRVNNSLGKSYQGLSLGERSATTVFMHSFSGGPIKGIELKEIKRSATTLDNPATIVDAAVSKLEDELFYLQESANKYYFSNQPNINRILLTHIENIKSQQVVKLEQEILESSLKGSPFHTLLWEERPSNISDSEQIKLIILRKKNEEKIKNILSSKGQSPRVFRNTIFILYPIELEENRFVESIKRKIAYENIEKDKNLNLSDEQKKDIKKELKKLNESLLDNLKRYYRLVAIPAKDGYTEKDLGIPTYGDSNSLDGLVYNKLRSEEFILENIAPLVIKSKYLSNNDFVSTYQIYQAALKTPGEFRPLNKSVIIRCFQKGVEEGLFGLGELLDEKPKCHYFKQSAEIALTENEIIITDNISKAQKEAEKTGVPQPEKYVPGEEKIGDGNSKEPSVDTPEPELFEMIDSLNLKFILPHGKVANIMGIMNYLQSKFSSLEIQLIAKDGGLSKQEFEDKVEEALKMSGIEFTKED